MLSRICVAVSERLRASAGGGAHREREDGVVLEEDGDGLPEVVELQGADVVAADENLPLLGIV